MKTLWSALVLGILALPVRAEGLISLDYCADQYVLALVDKANIRALSKDADSNYSHYAGSAAGIPKLTAEAEDILLTGPALIIRQWGGGVNAAIMFERLNIPVVQLGFGNDFDAVEANLRHVGQALGALDRAESLIDAMHAQLDGVDKSASPPRALYVTPGGVTAGTGTFIHEIMQAANVRNMAAEWGGEGWLPLDLEAIILDPPDLIITGFFDLGAVQPSHWSIARHALMKKLLEETQVVHIPGNLLACPAWFAAEAVTKINTAAHPARFAHHD